MKEIVNPTMTGEEIRAGQEAQASGVKSKVAASIAVGLLAVTSSAYVLKTILGYSKVPFTWDGAGHAWEGLIIARDVMTGDIFALMADTWRQGWWPFFHSWLLAPAFILFGAGYAVARCVSLAFFACFVATAHCIGREMSSRDGHWVGLIVVILSTTSWPLLALSALSMTEIPALFLSSLGLLFYLKALKSEGQRHLLAASLLMAAAFFTQPHIGLFLILAILLTQVTSGQSIFSRFNRWLFGPAFVVALVWFIDPRHILLFYDHSTFQPAFYEFWSLENWLYYPRYFLLVYHSNVIAGAAVSLGALYSLRRFRDPEVRVLFFIILVGLALLIAKLDHRERYIVSIVPAIWWLGGLGIVQAARKIAGRLQDSRKRNILVAAVSICLCLILVPGAAATYRGYPEALIRVHYWADERQGPAYEFISANAPAGCNHVAMFTSFDYYNALKSSTVRWTLEKRGLQEELTTRKIKKQTMQFLRSFLLERDRASYNRLENYLRFRNINVYEFHLLSFAKALDEHLYRSILQGKVLNPFSDKIVDPVALDPQVCCLIVIAKDGEDSLNRCATEYLAKGTGWRSSATGRFDDLGVTIALYTK
jgi:hypothetical protein